MAAADRRHFLVDKEFRMAKPRHFTLILFCAGFALVLALAGLPPDAGAQIFSQDLTMHSTTTSSGMAGRGGGSATGTEYFSKNAMRTNSSDGNDTIIRFDEEKFITIDNKKKTYSEMTFKQLQEMLDKASAAMGKMENMEALRKMMGTASASITVTKAGPGETIAGYPTEKYILKGPMEMEIWAAPSLKIPSAYYDALKFRMPSNPMFDMSKLYDEMKKIEGIPLKTVTTMKMMNMEMKTTKVVTSIEKGSLPGATFEVPAGYKLVTPKLE
jgi:hypothetical protein